MHPNLWEGRAGNKGSTHGFGWMSKWMEMHAPLSPPTGSRNTSILVRGCCLRLRRNRVRAFPVFGRENQWRRPASACCAEPGDETTTCLFFVEVFCPVLASPTPTMMIMGYIYSLPFLPCPSVRPVHSIAHTTPHHTTPPPRSPASSPLFPPPRTTTRPVRS